MSTQLSLSAQAAPQLSLLPPHLSGDDVSGHDGLAVLVLGFTGVGSVVDGLHVLHGQDALCQSGGPTRASVHQPPGCADVNWPLVLRELINVGVSKSNNDYVCGCFVFHHPIFIFFYHIFQPLCRDTLVHHEIMSDVP